MLLQRRQQRPKNTGFFLDMEGKEVKIGTRCDIWSGCWISFNLSRSDKRHEQQDVLWAGKTQHESNWFLTGERWQSIVPQTELQCLKSIKFVFIPNSYSLYQVAPIKPKKKCQSVGGEHLNNLKCYNFMTSNGSSSFKNIVMIYNSGLMADYIMYWRYWGLRSQRISQIHDNKKYEHDQLL